MMLAERGFGLLEAIVALTLIASTGLALFAWIGTSLESASRLRERDAAAYLKIAAVELMAGVNPLLEPEGERRVAGLEIKWKAAPAGNLTTSSGFVELGAGHFQLQLFDAEVSARDVQSGQRTRFVVKLLGLRRLDGGKVEEGG